VNRCKNAMPATPPIRSASRNNRLIRKRSIRIMSINGIVRAGITCMGQRLHKARVAGKRNQSAKLEVNGKRGVKKIRVEQYVRWKYSRYPDRIYCCCAVIIVVSCSPSTANSCRPSLCSRDSELNRLNQTAISALLAFPGARFGRIYGEITFINRRFCHRFWFRTPCLAFLDRLQCIEGTLPSLRTLSLILF
jgi:hypothetical protein